MLRERWCLYGARIFMRGHGGGRGFKIMVLGEAALYRAPDPPDRVSLAA